MTGLPDLTPAKAALERGRGVVIVGPPAVEQARVLWDLLPQERAAEAPTPATVIVTGDQGCAVEWAHAAPAGISVHPVTGLDRTIRLLGEGEDRIDILAGTPGDLTALAARTALKLESISTVVLAWPETIVGSPEADSLDTLLTQMPRARRIILSWNPAALEPLLERHAPRPHVVGDLPLDADGRPPRPAGPARFAVIPRERRSAATREVLDALNRPDVFLWTVGTPCPDHADAVLCLDLPTHAELQTLSASGPPVLLVSPGQVQYLRSIAAPLTALALPAAAKLARTAGETVRAEVVTRLEAGHLESEMAVLEPLFARYDPVEVAAAILALRRERTLPLPVATTTASVAPPSAPASEFTKLFVSVGKKDRAGAKDLVGALTREIGLAREQIGRIVVRDTFSIVEIVPAAAERAVQGLSATTIRSRRVQARPYREA